MDERGNRIKAKMINLQTERNHHTPTLEDYIEACYSEQIIDHSIRAKCKNAFYIHPAGVDGPTLDFFLAADGQVLGSRL